MSRQLAEKLESGGHTPYNSKMHLNPGATYDGFVASASVEIDFTKEIGFISRWCYSKNRSQMALQWCLSVTRGGTNSTSVESMVATVLHIKPLIVGDIRISGKG